MSVSSGTRVGGFQILSLIGSGGMGEVYRDRDTRLNRDVALKILPEAFALDPDRLARFKREAQVLASLNHPNIAAIYGLEEANGVDALVMELIEGPTLADRIERGPIPIHESLPIARQIAEALEAAHEQGVVHRDLKPANIKLRPDGTVKILDFGLAKALEPASTGVESATMSPTITTPAMTQMGMILGTAAYMSPEQAKGRAADKRSDVWAFGCVLYEMLTGRRPFDGETVSDTIAAILTQDPNFNVLPLNTPAAIRKLLRRCLSREPGTRFHHIADARLDIEDAQSNSSEGSASSPTPTPIRQMVIGAIAGATTVAIIVYAGWRVTKREVLAPRPIHVAVPMPGPNSAANGVLMSPDGRYLVSLGPGTAAVLHPLDGSPSRSLDLFVLCWAPDSRRLVLQRANGELLKMNVGGGPPVAFATAPAISGRCSWSRSEILLIDDDLRSICKVPASGGSLTKLTLDEGGVDTRRLRPRFLPDGRHFLYWSVASDGQSSVRMGDLATGQTKLIVASDAPAIYASGYLLFQRGAALVAQPFDERALALMGEPRAITSDAAPGSVATTALFDASDTDMLAFATTNGGVRGRSLWFDRHGNVLGTVPQPEGPELLNLAISPDGLRVAGNRRDPATANWDIWVVDLRSGTPTRVTTHPGIHSDPVWSPDGTEIAYVSRRRDAPGIYRLSIADGREQLLLKSDAVYATSDALRTTDWTRDGRFVVYESEGDVFAVPVVNGTKPLAVVATPAREQGGKVSPDGKWLAYQSLDSDEDAIYVGPFLGPGSRTRVSVEPGRHPHWRAHGKELFWVASSARSHTTARALYSVELSFSGDVVRAAAPKPVFPPHVGVASLVDDRSHWAVAPDGQRFLLRQTDGSLGPAVKLILNWTEQVKLQ